jgi:thymidine kinase
LSHVIVAGLPQDSYGKPFGAMPTILAMADNIVCLKAVCSKCKKINSATRTYRKIQDKAQVVVGGIDMFEPRCFECWSN